MTCRRFGLTREVGRVPETLRFQGRTSICSRWREFLVNVLILRESLTFYRLHDANLFQFSDGNAEAIRRKGQVLATLALALRDELGRRAVAPEITEIIADWVQNEADQLLLLADGGMPWKTIQTELRNYRVTHESASMAHWIFKCATSAAGVACCLPKIYYSLKRQLATNGMYREGRARSGCRTPDRGTSIGIGGQALDPGS